MLLGMQCVQTVLPVDTRFGRHGIQGFCVSRPKPLKTKQVDEKKRSSSPQPASLTPATPDGSEVCWTPVVFLVKWQRAPRDIVESCALFKGNQLDDVLFLHIFRS